MSFIIGPKLCGIRGLRACIVKKVKSWVGEFDYIPGTVYNAYNCADIAIRALIECTAERNIPLTLPTKEGKFYRSKDYTTPEAFFKAAAQDLDAADLFVNDKITLPRELEDLLPGDIISYDPERSWEWRCRPYTSRCEQSPLGMVLAWLWRHH